MPKVINNSKLKKMAKLSSKKIINNSLTGLINVGIGGGANVLIDWAWEQVDAFAAYDRYKHIAKIAAGALAGALVSNKYARAAADGVATVGVSNLIQELIDKTPETTEGLPEGTIGRLRYGSRAFRRAARGTRMAGLENFQEA